MYIQKVRIHNFRSIIDVEFDLSNYSLLIGENNAGKTSILTALRIFYEDGIKYNTQDDFPKCKTNDNESWVELWFSTTLDEQSLLKQEYRSIDRILKVRKYLKSDETDLVKIGQSNIYAYESGNLSNNLFYGARNISNAKLGNLLYIPEISKTDDNLKMSGPSPLRNMIDFVMQKVVKDSKTYTNLQNAFDVFNEDFRQESSSDGFSLKELTDDINMNIADWGIKFGLNINNITADNIIKNLVSHYVEDNQLDGQRVSINCFGQGMQRHLIYTLIRVGAKYSGKGKQKKKDFSPDFTLVLFDEPEAFLHPTQQEFLNSDLQKLSEDNDQQVLCSTHSAIFVSKNIESLPSLLKVTREFGQTNIFQIHEKDLEELFNENNSMFKIFSEKLLDPGISEDIKNSIRSKNLGSISNDEAQKLKEESLKYFLWLDGERSCSFFAKHVFICEGATEKVFFDYLLNTEWFDLKSRHIYFLDAMGKYNIHRYMNLFSKLGISHSVIYDRDQDSGINVFINDFIENQKNEFTVGIHSFKVDIEDFVGLIKISNNHLKPLRIIWSYKNNLIDKNKIKDLEKIIRNLI